MQSKASTVAQYLAQLPADRRAALTQVRATILANLDPKLEEGMAYGMISYFVPLSVYPAGYHCNPKLGLPYAGLASQKNYMSVYLMSAYGESEEGWLRERFAAAGKKLDMGKCCIRFKKLEDLPLEVIGEAIRRVPARTFLEHYERVRAGSADAREQRKASKTGAAPRRASKKTR